MKITQLHVQNYRSLVDCQLPIRDLNVVIGPNGAGKTALLEVFQMLQRGSRGELKEFFEAQGGVNSVLNHQSQLSLPRMRVSLGVDVDEEQSNAPMTYQFELVPEGIGYKVSSEYWEWPSDEKPFRYIEARNGFLEFSDPKVRNRAPRKIASNPLELGLSVLSNRLQEPALWHRSFDLRDFLLNIDFYYSTFDVGPRAPVRLPQPLTPTISPGKNGENLYSALYNLRESHQGNYEQIETLLAQAFPGFEKLQFPVVGGGQVTLAWNERSYWQPLFPNQLSEGTLRFLWLSVLLRQPGLLPPAIILLDEPEVSLHPELLKLLAALLQEASAASQIIVATHSSDLIRWLQPNEVLIADKEDGQTRFTWADELDLEQWLEEYTLSDLWRMGNLGGRP